MIASNSYTNVISLLTRLKLNFIYEKMTVMSVLTANQLYEIIKNNTTIFLLYQMQDITKSSFSIKFFFLMLCKNIVSDKVLKSSLKME